MWVQCNGNSDIFFNNLGERIQIQVKLGHRRPASEAPFKCIKCKKHLNGVLLAGRCLHIIECWLGSLVIFQVIRTSIAKKPFILLFIGGGGVPTPCPPSGSAHIDHECFLHLIYLIVWLLHRWVYTGHLLYMKVFGSSNCWLRHFATEF